MNKQTRKDMLQLGNEPMTRSALYEQRFNHWAIEAKSSHIVSFSEEYLIIESILRRHAVYDTFRYSDTIPNELKMMVSSSPLTKGKHDYWKERKGVYVILIYNTEILLPLTFDEQIEKKRYA